MKKQKRMFNLFILIAILLGACNYPSAGRATQEAANLTAAAQTIEALNATRTPTLFGFATPTSTSIFGIPATSTTGASTAPPAATATSNCNNMDFITDVTIPDGAVVTPNQAFTKTWRLKNVGTCTWNTSYAIVFSNGNSMNGPATQALSGSVGPGQTVDVSVNLTAPASPGDYTGYWKLRDASGVLFGTFYVQVKVQAATPTNTLPPAVAQVVLNAVGGESGTVYEPAAGQGVPSTILAGDIASNHLARGYMSFDIAALSGKTVNSANLNLSSCSLGPAGNPFTSLSGIWVGELQYPLPLDQSDYDVAGSGIQLLNAMPGSINVKTYVQSRATEGKARFQIRLHPAAGSSDGDSQADYISCNAGSVTLTIEYQP